MSPLSEDVVERHWPGAVPLADLVQWSVAVLAPHGFAPGGALPLVGVCRDEMLTPVVRCIQDDWGPSFSLSGLAGMPFLGRSGLAAAASHTPDREARARFVTFLFAHIGITADGAIGQAKRPWQEAPRPTCGALNVLRRELEEGFQHPTDRIDPEDPEVSQLWAAVLPRVDGPVPDLPTLTELVRELAVGELMRQVDVLQVADHDATDLAVISGIVVHGPDGDRVDVRDAWVRLGAGPPIELGRPGRPGG
jgi:hypothetical protein